MYIQVCRSGVGSYRYSSATWAGLSRGLFADQIGESEQVGCTPQQQYDI